MLCIYLLQNRDLKIPICKASFDSALGFKKHYFSQLIWQTKYYATAKGWN